MRGLPPVSYVSKCNDGTDSGLCRMTHFSVESFRLQYRSVRYLQICLTGSVHDLLQRIIPALQNAES
jgi:hypothetical protein